MIRYVSGNQRSSFGIKDFWKKTHKVGNRKLVVCVLVTGAFYIVFSLKVLST